MARCEDIGLLLGAFEDAELEPHEMQEVARHVVGCAACEAELAEYRQLGVALRGAMPLADLSGFSRAVAARLERTPLPFRTRVRNYFGGLAENFGQALAGGVAAAAIAIITAVLITPYARQFMLDRHHAIYADRIASAKPISVAGQRLASAAAPLAPAIAPQPVLGAADANVQPVDSHATASGKSRPSAVISRLEADSPSVAVWSEPENDTTVIWVPDQPR